MFSQPVQLQILLAENKKTWMGWLPENVHLTYFSVKIFNPLSLIWKSKKWKREAQGKVWKIELEVHKDEMLKAYLSALIFDRFGHLPSVEQWT